MYTLKDFTKNISPFLEYQTIDEFLTELAKVPDAQTTFQTLINNDREWLDTALKTRDSDGFHIFFFLDTETLKEDGDKPNELVLRNFSLSTIPTLKVIVYKH